MKQITKDPQVSGVGAFIQLGCVLGNCLLCTSLSRRTFFRACVFTIFLQHIWNGFIFFCGFYNVFLVPCIVLVSEMLSFTMVTKFNYLLI